MLIHRAEATPQTMQAIVATAELLIRAADILLDLIVITAAVGLSMLVYDFIHKRNTAD